MTRAPGVALLLFGLLASNAVGFRPPDDPPAKSEPKKDKDKDKDTKPAAPEPQFNSPPKGAVLVNLGRLVGRITKGSDGKVFSMDTDVGGQKKEVEINLAAFTKVRLAKVAEFDDKGNPKKGPPVITNGTADDLKGGLSVTVTVSGTRDGKWIVAKLATVTGE